MSYYCVPITVFIALSLFAGAAAREVSLKTSADDLLTVEGVDWGTSGYLPIKTMRTAGQLFYTYCPPRNGDENAPLIFWLQGGPGASGIAWGLLQEHGPFQLVDGKPVHREISWNNEFGVLYIDQPVGTGFSTAASNDSYAQNEYVRSSDWEKVPAQCNFRCSSEQTTYWLVFFQDSKLNLGFRRSHC